MHPLRGGALETVAIMCVNQKEIYIEALHRTMYVKCGHCPACEQEKALARSNRIRYEVPHQGMKFWFLTLTYDNKYIPYIRQSELTALANGERDTLNVYRDFDRKWRQVKNKDGREYHLVDKAMMKPLKTLTKEDFVYYGYQFDFTRYKNYRLPLLRHYLDSTHFEYVPDKSGVCLYEDVQRFFDRFRKDFKQKFISAGFEPGVDNFKYFVCTEYGPESHRPHIHILLALPQTFSRSEILDSINKTWPLCDPERTARYFDEAYDPAGYVSSYVNCRSSASVFFRYAKPFMPKHKMSGVFGFGLDVFSPSSVYESFRRGDLHFTVQRVVKGKSATASDVYPKYVINRYFPKFKGFNRLTSHEIQDVVLRPALLYHYALKLGLTITRDTFERDKDLAASYMRKGIYCNDAGKFYSWPYGMSSSQLAGKKPYVFGDYLIDRKLIKSIMNKIERAFDLFLRHDSLFNDYSVKLFNRLADARLRFAIMYSQIWALRSAQVMVDHLKSVKHITDYLYNYDNVIEHYECLVYHEIIDYALSLIDFDTGYQVQVDPNLFPPNIARTDNFAYWHEVYCKDKFIRDSLTFKYA